MVETRTKEAVVGVLMLAAGLGYLFITSNLPRRGAVDAAFVPYVLALATVGLGAIQILTSLRRPKKPAAGQSSGAKGGQPGGNLIPVAKTLVLVAAFTAALRPLGFPIAAALYLFLQFVVLTPRDGKKVRYPFYAVMAVACAAVIFVTFRYGFDLMLPAGPLTTFLP